MAVLQRPRFIGKNRTRQLEKRASDAYGPEFAERGAKPVSRRGFDRPERVDSMKPSSPGDHDVLRKIASRRSISITGRHRRSEEPTNPPSLWPAAMVRRATDIARMPAREALPPSLLVKFDRWFDRIIANGEEFHAGLEPFEPIRAGKRGRKKRRVPENSLRRPKKRKKETLPFLHDLSVTFSNNEAERNLRMKTARKTFPDVSGPSRGRRIA